MALVENYLHKGHHIYAVLALVENYLHKGHHIYADQLYSSVPLVDELERCNTGYTGTLVRTRQQLPSVVRGKSFKLNKGETKAWRDGKKLVLAWRDKGKPTIMISTVCQGSMTTVRGRRGETREKPLVVDKYNQSMGGVDIADQYGFLTHTQDLHLPLPLHRQQEGAILLSEGCSIDSSK